MKIHVVIADDHEIIREGFITMLKEEPTIYVCGQAADGAELVKLVEEAGPDIVITDIKMPTIDGSEAIEMIRRKNDAVKIIVLSLYDDEALIEDLTQKGIEGYLIKNTTREELVKAIHTVYKGKRYFSQGILEKAKKLRRVNRPMYEAFPSPLLTNRERDILPLMCAGYTIKEIGTQLNISARTVEKFRNSLLKKAGVRNRTELAVYALRKGLYLPPSK